jgi:hypothetical protein
LGVHSSLFLFAPFFPLILNDFKLKKRHQLYSTFYALSDVLFLNFEKWNNTRNRECHETFYRWTLFVWRCWGIRSGSICSTQWYMKAQQLRILIICIKFESTLL